MEPRNCQAAGIEIGDLADLDLNALRDYWRSLYRSEPPVRMSRELLMQAVAYRLQEQRHGGLKRAMRLKLVEVGRHGTGSKNNGPSRASIRRTIKPGTRFLREWQGRTHEVTATVDGRFAYRGATYKSLSAVARQITGTRWSGPAFFGLPGATDGDG